MKKLLILILACVALIGCKAKKLDYRDPFYFGHHIQNLKIDSTMHIGDYRALRGISISDYSFAGTVPGQENLRLRPKFDSTLLNPSVYSINMHIKPIGNNRFMYNYSCISGDNQCFFIFRGDTIKIEIIKLDK